MKKLVVLCFALLLAGSAHAQVGLTGPNLTPGQLPGTTTNSNATAGNVGEYIEADTPVGSRISLGNGQQVNLNAGISLTPGDWDVICDAVFVPDTTTTVVNMVVSISTTTGINNVTEGAVGILNWPSPGTAIGNVNQPVKAGPFRVSLSGNTPHFCVIQSIFGTSTEAVYGRLRARRVR